MSLKSYLSLTIKMNLLYIIIGVVGVKAVYVPFKLEQHVKWFIIITTIKFTAFNVHWV